MAKKKKEKVLKVQNTLIDVAKVRRIIDRLDSNVIDERSGAVIDKNKIEHLMVIYDRKENFYMGDYREVITEETEEEDYSQLSEEELNAKIEEEVDWADARSELDNFDPDSDVEDNAKANTDDVLQLIKKELRLNVETNAKLKRHGWFVVPIYAGMTEFRPLWWADVKDKCYAIVLKDEPLFTLPQTAFNVLNEETWKFNAMNAINTALKGTEYEYRFHATAPIHHVRNKEGMLELKQAMGKYEAIKKLRIKMGNQIVSLYYWLMGKQLYDEVKTELNTEENKKSKSKSKKEKSLKDTKIIEYIVKESKELYDHVFQKNMDKQIDKWTKELVAFSKKNPTMDKENAREFISMILPSAIKQGLKDPGVMKSEKEFKKVTEEFKDLKFLDSYAMYQQANTYLVEQREEEKAKSVLSEEVRKHRYWQKYLVSVSGLAETIAGYILTNLNPELSVHASGFVRYCGLDQVPARPDLDKLKITDVMRIDAFALAVNQYWHIMALAEQKGTEITRANYHKFTEDSMRRGYSDFVLVRSLVNQFGLSRECLMTGKLEEKIEKNLKAITDNFSYLSFANSICQRYIIRRRMRRIEFKDKAIMISVPFVHKRARKKTDVVYNTHITKDGKLGVKKGCGYNTVLKSKLEVVFTQCIRYLKKNDGVPVNPWQIRLLQIQDEELRKVMEQYGDQVVGIDNTDVDVDEIDPNAAASPVTEVGDGDKKEIKVNMKYVMMRANRRFVQEFLPKLWIAMREIDNLPLNGGLYIEEKLGRYHGFDRPQILERACRTKAEYAKYAGIELDESETA